MEYKSDLVTAAQERAAATRAPASWTVLDASAGATNRRRSSRRRGRAVSHQDGPRVPALRLSSAFTEAWRDDQDQRDGEDRTRARALGEDETVWPEDVHLFVATHITHGAGPKGPWMLLTVTTHRGERFGTFDRDVMRRCEDALIRGTLQRLASTPPPDTRYAATITAMAPYQPDGTEPLV